MYQQRGKDALAARYYLEALRWDSTLAESHNNLGLLLHKKGELDNDIKQYEKAVHLAPDVSFYLSNLGNAYLETERLELAQIAAERASTRDPALSSAHILLGEIHARRGEFKQAIIQWEAISTTGPTKKQLRAKIALARRRLAAQER